MRPLRSARQGRDAVETSGRGRGLRVEERSRTHLANAGAVRRLLRRSRCGDQHALFEKLNPILDRERTREAYRLEVALLPTVLERLPPAQAGAPARLRAGPQRSRLRVRRPVRDGGRGGRRETRAPGHQPSPAARRAVHPLRRTDTSARWPRDLRPLCAGTGGCGGTERGQ